MRSPKLVVFEFIMVNNMSSSLQPCFVFSSTSSESDKYDVTIVGGGIVGLATARELLLRKPNLKLCVLEKENQLSMLLGLKIVMFDGRFLVIYVI